MAEAMAHSFVALKVRYSQIQPCLRKNPDHKEVRNCFARGRFANSLRALSRGKQSQTSLIVSGPQHLMMLRSVTGRTLTGPEPHKTARGWKKRGPDAIMLA